MTVLTAEQDAAPDPKGSRNQRPVSILIGNDSITRLIAPLPAERHFGSFWQNRPTLADRMTRGRETVGEPCQKGVGGDLPNGGQSQGVAA